MKKTIVLSLILLSAFLFTGMRKISESSYLKEVNIISKFEVDNRKNAIVQKNKYKVNKIFFNSNEEYAEILFYEKKYRFFNFVIKVESDCVCNIYLKKEKI